MEGGRLLFDDAGLPDGVFCDLFAPVSATEHILAHPLVRGVALTGSERAGTAVGAAAGKNLKLTAAFDDAFVECGVRIIRTPGPSGPYLVGVLGAGLSCSCVGLGW